jgi:hypothetical protein
MAIALLWVAQSLHSQNKLVLSSYNSVVDDAALPSIIPDDNRGNAPHMNVYAWTQGGEENINRPILRFDLEFLPANADVEEALLVLHWDPFTNTQIGVHTGSTAFDVLRITEPWDEQTVTWNTQPATTPEDMVQVPAAAFDRQNYVINVTEMVRDMAAAPGANQGFMLRLVEEFPFQAALLASSDHPDVSRHPQLWLTYSDGMVGTQDDAFKAIPTTFDVFPNPTSGPLTLRMRHFSTEKYTATLFDAQGKLLSSQNLAGSFSIFHTPAGLPAGAYWLKISNEHGAMVQEEKIVVE